jgi:hypothetical protein
MITFPWWNKPPEGQHVYWFEIEHLLAPYAHQGLPQASSDKEYLLPNDPAALIRRSNVHRIRTIPDKLDCNHLVTIFRGWLAKKKWNVFCAIVRLEGHTVAGFIQHDGIDFSSRKAILKNKRIELWDVQAVKKIDGEILGLWV